MDNNILIITQFEKLIKFIKNKLDNYNKNDHSKEITADTFRLKQLTNVLKILKNIPFEITFDNLKEVNKLSGIGKGTINRITEILETNKLAEIDNFNADQDNEKEKIIEELEQIVGIGRNKAIELYNLGVTSIKDLKKKIKNNEIEVNDKILLGIKYYNVFFGNIPRSEITEVYKLFQSVIKEVNKYFKTNYIFEICGSYRREKPTSGDIDILISNPIFDDTINHLELFITKLKEPLKKNNNQPLLIDDITNKNYETKYMGFLKYKDNLVRRVDIRYVNYDSYYSALLYFTGSADFNKKLRSSAKKLGYKLSEYGIFDINNNNNKLDIESEYDIFTILKIEYLHPRLR